MKLGRKALFVLLAALALSGCAAPEAGRPQAQAAPGQSMTHPTSPVIDAADEAVALSPAPAAPVIPEAQASGYLRQSCPDGMIDYSHTEDGYVMAMYTGTTEKRLKVLVKGPTTTYSYNLPKGEWVVFPLSDGDGHYHVGIYENVYDSKYALVTAAEFETRLRDEFVPFLRPNQYVRYDEATRAVSLGAELTAGLTHPLEKVAAVYDYVVSNLSYDYEKAATVKSGYLPDLDQVLLEKKGICFDYAALMCAMLRSQQIPCKLVVGYAGQTYHAWISVWTEENGWIDGFIFFDGSVWKRMDPTFASSSGGSQEILDFIEHGSYTVKYLY